MKKIIFLVFLTLVIIGCTKEIDVLDYNLREHANLALHNHPVVKISVNGENIPIPANMGISNDGMRVIHTHDATGTLHVESPVPYQFVLEELFIIWGYHFNDTCVFDKCNNETHELSVFVNGEESNLISKLPLHDKDLIEIKYEQKNEA